MYVKVFNRKDALKSQLELREFDMWMEVDRARELRETMDELKDQLHGLEGKLTLQEQESNRVVGELQGQVAGLQNHVAGLQKELVWQQQENDRRVVDLQHHMQRRQEENNLVVSELQGEVTGLNNIVIGLLKHAASVEYKLALPQAQIDEFYRL